MTLLFIGSFYLSTPHPLLIVSLVCDERPKVSIQFDLQGFAVEVAWYSTFAFTSPAWNTPVWKGILSYPLNEDF